MVTIKYNKDKNSYTLKGLTLEHIEALSGLMNHVILGQGGPSDAIGEIWVAIEPEEIDPCNVSVKIDSYGYFSLSLE